MKKVLSFLSLLICIYSGISANILKNESTKIKIQQSDNFPVPPNCGFGKKPTPSSERIHGGVKVQQHELPWMVYLSIRCGATLINSRWILTAAHCFDDADPDSDADDIVAYIGEENIWCEENCNANAIEVQISKKFIHEDYDIISNDNDIALLQLKDAVTFSEGIQPICLPYDNQDLNIFNQDATVSGWGQDENSEYSKQLLKTTVKIWEADKCEKVTIWSDFYICAGGIAGIDSCYGDSGGPLSLRLRLEDGSEPHYQVGIVSYGLKTECGLHGHPTAYTNVKTYIPWIRKTIMANE